MIPQINETKRLQISHEIDVAYAALDAKNSAKRIGFSTADQCMISIAVSELAQNIINYAKKGTIVLRIVEDNSKLGIEVVAEDSGPGIQDMENAMQDKFSTGSTLGVGLPGTKRLMDDFQICSSRESGTKVTVKKWMP